MPICNMCESEFDVEKAPGALMFGHPSTIKEAVPVWKAHLCQDCECRIVRLMKRPPVLTDPATDDGPLPVVSKAEQQADNAVKLEMIESTCTRCGRLIAHVAYCADCMARAENPNRSKPFTLNYDQWEEKKPCLFSSECGKYNNQDQCREPCDAYGRWLALPHEDPPDCWGLKH